MTKIFLDSNIWLRYFLRDNDQFASVEKLLKLIDEGNFLPYCSSMVIMEIIFVLTRLYKKSTNEVIQCVEAILKIRNITILEKTDIETAIAYYKKLGVKFSDCLIASQIVKNMVLVTFDKDFSKFREIKTQTPIEILSKKSIWERIKIADSFRSKQGNLSKFIIKDRDKRR